MHRIKKILCLCISLIVLFLVGFTNKTSSVENSYKEFNIPQYSFEGNIIKDAHVIQYDGFRIVQPLYMQSFKQKFGYKEVANEFKKLPKVLTKNIKEIQLLDYRNANDEYWEKTYKMKNFITYASNGDNKINFYANNQLNSKYNKSLIQILAHESAHSLDVAVSSEKNKLSNSTEWYNIIQEDFKFKKIYNFKYAKLNAYDYGRYCSKYAMESKSSVEDFAESVTGYVMDKEGFMKEYPNRSEKIKQLLK